MTAEVVATVTTIETTDGATGITISASIVGSGVGRLAPQHSTPPVISAGGVAI
jgi:hypothetical protein